MADESKDEHGAGGDLDRSAQAVAPNPFGTVSSDEFMPDLAKAAKEDAIHSNPTVDSVVLPDAIQKVKGELRGYNQQAVQACQDEMQRYEQSIDRLTNAFTMPSLRNKCMGLRSELTSAIENSSAARMVVEKKREFDRSKRDFEFFQKKHDRVRLPEQGTEIHLVWFKNPWIILPLLVVLESLLVSFTMGENVKQAEVWTICGVVSVVNILVSFLVGRYEWSAMTLHYNPLTKWAARILVPLYIYITLHINVGMGAFREANYLTARAARKMAKLAEQGVVPAPFQTDGFLAPWSYTGDFGFTSWMTLVLGICFALFALIKGAHADDKFPTYSKKFRACKYKQEEVWQAIETYQQAHEGDVKEFRSEMERFLPAAISQIDQWGKFTNTAQRRFVDYEQWIPKLETVYRECWTTYVGAHEKSRLSDYQVPEIFSMPLERLFEGENMEPSYIFSDVADIVMPDTEREGKMAKFKSDCRSIFEEEYKAGDEKITQLDEILKKRVAAGECHL